MEKVLSSLYDDPDDTPTVPGVYVMPEEAFTPLPDGDPVLDDPSSWGPDEDTQRFSRAS
jgi:hypothetical protein